MTIVDARIRELSFLTKLELAGGEISYTPSEDRAESQMVLRLLHEALINDVGSYPAHLGHTSLQIDWVGDAAERRRMDIAAILYGKTVRLSIGHRGRVRRAELEESLRSGRDRDPTGLALARKYVERDITIALLYAAPAAPVSLAFLDMNGLKTINDESGSHAAGDEAIRTYLQVIVDRLGDSMDAYRGEGGDEVIVVMRSTSLATAAERMRSVLQHLQRETVLVADTQRPLSAACGVVSTTTASTSPPDLLKRVDAAQYRAKTVSRTPGRPAVLAVEDREPEIVPATSS